MEPEIIKRDDGKIEIPETFYNGGTVNVIYRPSPEPVDPMKLTLDGLGFYPELNQRSYIEDGLLVDQDVPIKMRDGITLYADLIRPKDQLNDLPCIISWCFYGKRPGDSPKNWQIFGVPPGTASKMTKFEGPDPEYWCNQGYAVLNVDTRGAGNSEGNLVIWGEQDGRDGYDTIEWVAEQPWSNGRVTIFGNSGLCMCQWWIGAEQPPHLTCLGAWEGTSDLYREFICEGGIPAPGFNNFVMSDARGPGYIEDYVQMIKEHPLIDAYWESKIPQVEKIKVPVYCTAGWSHLHLRGSLNAFRKIRSPKKWLRVHRDFEWPDTYSWWNLEDLKRFYDRYMKDIHNGWEMTPKVRIEVIDAYDYDFQVNRPETSFPIKRTEYKKLYLDASNGSLNDEPIAVEASASYDGNTGETCFDITFTEDVELTGYMKLHAWVAAPDHDDADIFLTVLKLDEEGEWIPTNVLGEPHPGAWGKIRVSHRELDEDLSSDFQPVMAHRRELKLAPGEIVPIDVEFYPHSRIWHAGQQLRLRFAGRYIREGWFEPFSWETDNVGETVVYTGGQYDSYLQVPVIPPKYQTKGGYVYR
ncbi:Cocaine esterase [Slackia heliotrinireducens]|uniref:Putative hydrolase, CocE/NonD family n=1 Tax=Slackia heliotrinireducens (strain ATCC 29202 / DSM 20476 / NCTC 11029 / RHS 1) TaxID=471855 RepID=C7N5G9_SLAHD|nr:CocE/NonD family hydrolase [Slackia heliotrinireducens]ACV22154.1 putative hydrolase, CocE/NonD family [Slackia heliotrinireducens DSM 20476]VEH00210.1 Cocaine esterase [Slackia heliotrinireducens]